MRRRKSSDIGDAICHLTANRVERFKLHFRRNPASDFIDKAFVAVDMHSRLGIERYVFREIHVVEVGIEVVRTAFLRIICQVEEVERCCCSAVGALAAVRIQLADIHFTHIVVRQLLKVVLDVRRCQCRLR